MHTQDVRPNMRRVLKMGLLALPLVAAAWFFGTVCRRMEGGHLLLILAMRDLVPLLRDLVLALALLAVTSGIVALLFRPLSMAAVAFVISGVALLVGCGVTPPHLLLALLFVLAALSHSAITQRDLSQRVRFSIGAVSASELALLVVLAAVAAAAVYLGAASYTQKEGFSIPERYSSEFAERLSSRVAAAFPSLIREQVHDGLRSYTEQFLTEELERLMKPVTPYVPITAALALFLPLLAVSYVLSWVVLPVLWLVLVLLRAIGVTRITSETIEVKTMVLS
jgi:hypothetical protein